MNEDERISSQVVLREILESPTHIYIVQDYIDGPNLFEKIGQMNPYTEHDVSRYSLQILKGLQVRDARLFMERSICLVHARTKYLPRETSRRECSRSWAGSRRETLPGRLCLFQSLYTKCHHSIGS